MFFDIFKKKKALKYTSCPWLEYGIDFDLGVYGSNLKTCCYLSNPGGGNVYLKKDYFGEKINWKEIFKTKNEHRQIQQSGETVPGCEGCMFLEERMWRQEDIITHIIFDHWTHCNCKCSYCYTQDDKQTYDNLKTYNVLPIVKEMLKKKILKKEGAIGFGGGEPTMLQEFEDLIALLLKNGFTNLRVPTSGIKFSPIMAKGIALRRLQVVVSIDSGCAKTYKEIKNMDAYNTVCENLKKYANAQTAPDFVVSKYIVIPHINDTKEEIDAWLKFNIENKILSVVIDIENSWMDKVADKSYSYIFELFEYIKSQAQELGIVRCEVCDRAQHTLNKMNQKI